VENTEGPAPGRFSVNWTHHKQDSLSLPLFIAHASGNAIKANPIPGHAPKLGIPSHFLKLFLSKGVKQS
jgi:hypothetical protein